ncbi:unnamed protein product [Echinostoma caproni]|uniref:PUM-HD domain-containing protein n=1 Tax=Echinostoma caproni TaxID=27848 RepID=A0A183B265_9TREM|nr:unnamed protein product [Echinostoma caproni]
MTEVTELEPFESELLAIHHLDESALTRLEQEVGLGGGGSWWIDPSQTPVELDAHGELDEGAIVDVEAQVRVWLRHSFDKNPTFRDHNYHLLNRLNELARLQGLVEQAQLQQSMDLSDGAREQLYHSTLSLHSQAVPNLGASYDLTNPTPGLHHFDVHRSLEGSLSQQQQYAQMGYKYGPYSQGWSSDTRHGSVSGYDSPSRENNGFAPYLVGGSLYESTLGNGRLDAKPSGMPQVHRNPKYLPSNPAYGLRKRPSFTGVMGRLPLPDATSSPDRSHDRHALRGNENNPGERKNSAHGSMLDNLLRPTLTSSLPFSDPDSDVDVTKSLDGPRGVNPLSQSLSDADMLRVSNIKPNASYSSMRSSDVFEMARLQESHLRKHSGSRNKLHGSSGSLTSSLLDVRASADQALRSGGSGNQSHDGSIRNLSDVDLSKSHDGVVVFRDTSRGPPERQLTVRAKEPIDSLEDEDNRRTLIIHDNAELGDNLTESENHLPPDSLPNQARGNVVDHELSEPPTPVINDPPKTSGIRTAVNNEVPGPNVFFPHSPGNEDRDSVSSVPDHKNPVTRLDSFELLEARMSAETFSPGALKSAGPRTPSHQMGAENLPETTHSNMSGPPLTAKLPIPGQPPRSTSPTPSHSQRPSYPRPPSGPRMPSASNGSGPATSARSSTRLPVQSRLPTASASSANSRVGPRPPVQPQQIAQRGQLSRPGSRPSSASSSLSRPRSREPMTQIQSNTTNTGRIPVRAMPPVSKLAGDHQSRPTTSQLQVTRSDTSPVRSTRMNNKRLGQRPVAPGSRRT